MRTLDRERGAVLVETAITIVAWLALLLFAIDLTRIMLSTVKLQHSVYEATRWGTLGHVLAPPNDTRELAIKEAIRLTAEYWGVPVDPNNIRLCPVSSPSCSVDSVGGPTEVIRGELRAAPGGSQRETRRRGGATLLEPSANRRAAA